jgi:transposase
MSPIDLELPETHEDLKAFALALQARVMAQDAALVDEQTAHAATPLALALCYALNRREALLRYTGDGRLEIDNNRAENAIRGIAIGRKNWLFAGADCGGERAAAIYTLIETAKLNNVNPQVWLTDVLDRIGKGHPINRIDELLPWMWSANKAETGSVK